VRVERARGTAAAFHARPLPDELHEPVLWAFQPEAPALVLGSSQPLDVADHAACEAAGVEVVRRRSGGGAVLLVPGEVVWVDLLLPSSDARWVADVGRASWWVGEAWAGAVAASGGPAGLVVHRGPMLRTEWSALACFAGVGPGEVLDDRGRKVVGISQRRTRAMARFQGSLQLQPHGRQLASLVMLTTDERVALAAALDASVAPVDVDPDRLVQELALLVDVP
jgi:lipoate---protein ligase